MEADEVCSYTEDGQHRYFNETWRKPVGWTVQRAFSPPPDRPAPLMYWEIEQCRRCGYQRATPHGFMPKRLPPTV